MPSCTRCTLAHTHTHRHIDVWLCCAHLRVCVCIIYRCVYTSNAMRKTKLSNSKWEKSCGDSMIATDGVLIQYISIRNEYVVLVRLFLLLVFCSDGTFHFISKRNSANSFFNWIIFTRLNHFLKLYRIASLRLAMGKNVNNPVLCPFAQANSERFVYLLEQYFSIIRK